MRACVWACARARARTCVRAGAREYVRVCESVHVSGCECASACVCGRVCVRTSVGGLAYVRVFVRACGLVHIQTVPASDVQTR